MKPTCARCGKPHWRFVACDNADEAAAIESANAEKRERAKVHPVWRGADGRLQTGRPTWNTGYGRPSTNNDPPQAA